MTKKNSIPMHGYMWKTWGYTRLHIWGLNIVGGIIISVGGAAATFVTLGIVFLPDHIFWRCVAVSVCASLLCIAMVLGSIFALTFYYGAKKLGFTEDSNQTTEPTDAASPSVGQQEVDGQGGEAEP